MRNHGTDSAAGVETGRHFVNRHKLLVLLGVCLLLATPAAARSLQDGVASSANYTLAAFSGAAGGRASSPNFGVNLTVGQGAAGAAASPNYRAGLGYEYQAAPGGGLDGEVRIYLPVVQK